MSKTTEKMIQQCHPLTWSQGDGAGLPRIELVECPTCCGECRIEGVESDWCPDCNGEGFQPSPKTCPGCDEQLNACICSTL